MSLQKRNGMWYAILYVPSLEGPKKQQWFNTGYTISGNNKRLAQAWHDQKKLEINNRRKALNGNLPLTDYFKIWLEEQRQLVPHNLREITYEWYQTLVEKHFIPYFESKKFVVADVEPDDIQTYLDYKRKNGKCNGKGGLSPKSLKSHRSTLFKIFRDAVSKKMILQNPCLDLKEIKKAPAKENYYDENQVKTMLEALKQEELFDLIFITTFFGLRRSEVLGLKWSSIDFCKKTIHIENTVVKMNHTILKDGSTKNDSSNRILPMNDAVLDIFKRIKQREEENRTLFGSEYVENDYVFKWPDGKPYSPDFISKKFQKLIKKYNLPPITFHGLRHSCASILSDNGVDLKHAAEWLGHADIATTGNIYTIVGQKGKKATSNVMAGVIFDL